MGTFEEEFEYVRGFVDRTCRFLLLPKKIDLRGAGNFVREGPSIIIGNHAGSYKDVATMFRTVPRMIYFTANRMIFTRDGASELVLRHLHRHMGRFGGFLHVLLGPFYRFMVTYVSGHIARVGTIPVDIYGSKRASILSCQEYLKAGRAVVALQGRGRVFPKDPNPYVKEFRRGVSIMAYNLYKERGLSVPVTPLSIFGTHIMWGVPATVKVNVGPPMFIRDYWSGDEGSTVEAFRSALQKNVSGLLRASLGWEAPVKPARRFP
ncbi:MAG TPA: lysophospholipid acyltransferase family protein [Candidatus Aminicenantes bacterium]|nr:lysophospholipid acyltransferase family protein [Candidatus Aminicenantes bacterium]HRY66349.1 lysophospholipid acyltransferase family protein [Candidatus Aminicenantes bacterium]HRZ73276.1 lysophospholipid acyltransferase family protein [Candidatus Aminicenantes bacterium]